MHVAFAAIGGPELDVGQLADGVAVLAERGDFDEVAFAPDVPFSLRIHVPWTGSRSAWSLVEVQGEDGLSTLLDAARALAAHARRSVRAVASVVERSVAMGRVEIGYRAYEISPEGTSTALTVDAADRTCGEVDEDSSDELGDLLSILMDDSAVKTERPLSHGRCFRRKPFVDDPRLARLAASIVAAKAVSFEDQGNDRVQLRIEGSDGTKLISRLTTAQADVLRRATSR